MNLYIHFLFIGILLLWRNQCILGTNVILKVDKTLCVGKNITLTCQIPSFTSFATWNRNGTAITTCTSGGSCTVTLQPIDGITYYFYGSSTGIEVSFQTHLAEDDVQWICNYNSKSYQYVFDILNECPISEMSTPIATDRTTSANSVFEFISITIPMIQGSITPTSDIPTPASIYLNTGSIDIYAHTVSTNYYSNTETETTTTYTNTETTSFDTNIETTPFYENTETTNIVVSTKTYEMDIKTLGIVSNFKSTYQSLFATTAANYTSGSLDITSQIMTEPFAPPFYSMSSYKEITVPTIFETSFSQTFLETSISLNSSKFSLTVSPSKIGDSFIASSITIFSVASFTTDTLDSFFEISNVSRVNKVSIKIETGQSPAIAATVNLSGKSENSKGVYSSGISSFRNSDMYASAMRSETQLWSIIDIQEVPSDFQSTSLDQYSQRTYEVISSGISEYSETVLQSTSLLLSFNTNEESTGTDIYKKTTKMLNFATQSSILTMDSFLLKNHSSIQISTVLPDLETTWYATTINYNSKTMQSRITPSSQRTYSDNSYNEIGTSFKDLSREIITSTLSSGVVGSISTLPTSTIKSGLSEKNKDIIFISTTSAVVTIIVVISLMIFAKVYMSKYNLRPPAEDDNISWSNHSTPPKAAFTDYSVSGKRIYPLLNTSSTSFKMHLYEYNLNDIV